MDIRFRRLECLKQLLRTAFFEYRDRNPESPPANVTACTVYRGIKPLSVYGLCLNKFFLALYFLGHKLCSDFWSVKQVRCRANLILIDKHTP